MVLTFLRMVPLWAYALAAALLWGGFQHYRAKSAGEELARHITETAQLREQAMHAALIETTRRIQAQQKAAEHAQASTIRANAAAAAAVDTAGKLRAHAAKLASASACNSASSPVSDAASAPGIVLADMLGRLEASGRELAVEADKRGIAGAECEARYKALEGAK